MLQYESAPLVVFDGPDELGLVVARRFSATFGASYVIIDGLGVGLSIPLYGQEGGWDGRSVESFAVGDLRFEASWAFVRLPFLDVAVLGDAWLPTSTQDTFTGERRPRASLGMAAQGSLGPLIVGAAYLELADLSRLLPRPQLNQPTDRVSLLFPHRYGGVGLTYQRRAWIAGAAMRARPWLGVGVSAGIAQVSLGEIRHVWAGFAGREPLGDPGRDLVLSLGGSDAAVPMVSAGALIAPPPLPLEIALSMSYAAAAELGGAARLSATRDTTFPTPELTNPRAEAVLPGSVVLRAGMRYLGERVLIETGGDITLYTGDSPLWTVSGVSVRDSTGATGTLGRVPSLVDRRAHGALRAAIDVEAVRGFVWLTAGYAYRTGSSRTAYLTPAHADPAGHIVAVGAEGQWSTMVFTIGYSRMLETAITVDASNVELINPFDGGTAPVGAGTYDGAVDMFGAGIDITW